MNNTQGRQEAAAQDRRTQRGEGEAVQSPAEETGAQRGRARKRVRGGDEGPGDTGTKGGAESTAERGRNTEVKSRQRKWNRQTPEKQVGDSRRGDKEQKSEGRHREVKDPTHCKHLSPEAQTPNTLLSLFLSL